MNDMFALPHQTCEYLRRYTSQYLYIQFCKIFTLSFKIDNKKKLRENNLG